MTNYRYAERTVVPVDRSKCEIERVLRQHGAEAYHTGWDRTRDVIEFGWKGKQIRFVLPRAEDEKSARRADQKERQRWRALHLVVRAKLEAVEAGIATFEHEFLAFIVVPGRNETIGEILVPRIESGKFDVNRALPEGR